MRIEAKLADLGLTLPAPLRPSPRIVLPFAWVRVRGNRAYVSGHVPRTPTARWPTRSANSGPR